MPYMVRCKYCNFYYFSVCKQDAEVFIIEHICDKHGDAELSFHELRISREDYLGYLHNKDNPRFWEALRLIRKPHKLKFPTFLIGVEGG
jgi:hypothetical protein